MSPSKEDLPVASIRIELIDPDAMELWRTVAKVAAVFGGDRRWCLVGGLMVALFAIEAQQAQRATTDIDFLADARARPSGTVWATQRLELLGATLLDPGATGDDHGFRFDIDGQIVDVLAPDGLGPSTATTRSPRGLRCSGRLRRHRLDPIMWAAFQRKGGLSPEPDRRLTRVSLDAERTVEGAVPARHLA
jgi:hypothetical protein